MEQRIVVVEYAQKHIEDAKRYFATIPNATVEYARNYDEFFEAVCDMRQMRPHMEPGTMRFAPRSDLAGVITDIMFPGCGRETETNPLGLRVALQLTAEGIPFVLNTSGYRYSDELEWIHDICSDQCWSMVDSSTDNRHSHHKDWNEAYTVLQRIIRAGQRPKDKVA